MISYLKGQILEIQNGKVTLGVGNLSNMIGYSCSVPQEGPYHKLSLHATLELFVVTYFRQDALDLFGFFIPLQRFLFTELLSVSGIGPKSALQILSGGSAEVLLAALLEDNGAALEALPGVSRKIVSRLLLELKPRLQKKKAQGIFVVPLSPFVYPSMFHEACHALVGLGYEEKKVKQTLKMLLQQQEEQGWDVQRLIRTGLQEIAINGSS